MNVTIERQEAGWVLRTDDSEIVCDTEAGALLAANAVIAALMTAEDEDERKEDMPANKEEALLPERWVSGPNGAVMRAATGPERDFSQCSFTWRQLPLSLMLKTTSSHGGFDDGAAELCGFIDTATGRQDGGVDLGGRFYNNEAGEAARAILIGQGQYGCSVDPSEYVDAEFECTDMDDDGWCMDGVVHFTAYEIAGLTLVPFPGFEGAWVTLEGIDQTAIAASAAVMTTIPAAPEAAWFQMTEPEDPTNDGGDVLVAQADGQWGVPWTAIDNGFCFGHAALWETCHIGYANTCVTAPASAAAYSHFHIGEVQCADRTRVATGVLFMGTDHADMSLDFGRAQDHYANTGVAVADLRVVNGVHGVWVCGALRPGLTEDQVRVIRASTMSGDWRRRGGSLELAGILLVNVPGFPIAREAVTASGIEFPTVKLRSRTVAGVPMALTAAGIVRRGESSIDDALAVGTVEPCTDCLKTVRGRRLKPAGDVAVTARLDRIEKMLDRVTASLTKLEIRTVPMIRVAAEEMRGQFSMPAISVGTLHLAASTKTPTA